jgi:hypothetical protein
VRNPAHERESERRAARRKGKSSNGNAKPCKNQRKFLAQGTEHFQAGRQTGLRLVDENSPDPRCRNTESDSITTDERELQSLKHPEPISSTVRGMMIDRREEFEKIFHPILRNNESDSIKTDERDLQ